MVKRKNVFISHHHGDDKSVDDFISLVETKQYDCRNSSVRMKPANVRRVKGGNVKDETIKRLLRMKMRWASTVIVLIGERTHTRKWVNWEIEQAAKLGKRIVGVYLSGGTASTVPKALNDYGDSIVNWNSDSVINAIEGKSSEFQNPDGSPRSPVHQIVTIQC